MKFYVFSGELNDNATETIQELCNLVSDLDCELTVFLDTNGGFVAWGENILKVLNTKYKLITLIGGPELSSAGLLIWLGFKGKKDVAVGLSSTAHMSTVRNTLRDGNVIPHSDSKEDSAAIGRFSTPLIKKILTPKQFTAYKLGADVLVPYNQLKKHALAHNKTL